MKNTIKETKRKQGLKTVDILRETGFSKSYFYGVIKGEYVPSLANARKLAEALNTTVEKLFPEN